MASPILALEGIRKTYNEGTPIEQEVLHGVSFTVHDGEFTALIGPSGSGKSTLLNILGLLEPATSGSYRLNGQEVAQASEDERTRARLSTLGFVFQFHHLLPAFTALENVLLPGLMRDRDYTPKCRAEALRLLKAVGLADAIAKKPTELSGGMQQRVAIARALILSPKLVLADEPTGNLDTQTADDIFTLLRQFNQERGTAFLIVTHDPRLAERCDRKIRLVDGVIAEDLRGPVL
ncbi:MAG: ABC transporter ATP-binding protein [Candidatus Binatia bacterium]